MNALISAKRSWGEWTERTTNRRIMGAAVTVGLFTAVVKVVSILKELAIAWWFGIGDDLDVLFTALIVPMTAVVVVSSSLNTSFIPTYIKVRDQQGDQAASRLFGNAIVWSVGALILLAVTLAACAPLYFHWLAIDFSPAKLHRTISLFYSITPWIVVRGSITLWTGVLNAGKRFAIASVSPAITPAVVVLSLLVAGAQPKLTTIAFAMIAGALLELGVLASVLHCQGAIPKLRWYGLDENMRTVIGRWMPMVAGSLVMSSSGLVDQVFVSSLPAGSVATFGYGHRLVAFATSLVAFALGTAIFPYLSTMVAKKSWKEIDHTVRRYLRFVLISTLPISCLFLLFSEVITSTVLQHGEFTQNDSRAVANINSVFALQVPFYVTAFVLVRYLAAVGRNVVLMAGAFCNLAINIVLNFLFMPIWGAAGVALSTVFVYVFSATVLTTYTFWHLKKQSGAVALPIRGSSESSPG